MTESWQRLHFYEALNAAFRGAAKPLLLLIDDLQWCDQDSLEWLHSLFRSEPAGRRGHWLRVLVLLQSALRALRLRDQGPDLPCCAERPNERRDCR